MSPLSRSGQIKYSIFHMVDRDFFAPCSGSCMSLRSFILQSSYRLSLFSFLQSPFPFITRCSRHLKFPHLNDQYLPSSSPLTPDPTAIIFHCDRLLRTPRSPASGIKDRITCAKHLILIVSRLNTVVQSANASYNEVIQPSDEIIRASIENL